MVETAAAATARTGINHICLCENDWPRISGAFLLDGMNFANRIRKVCMKKLLLSGQALMIALVSLAQVDSVRLDSIEQVRTIVPEPRVEETDHEVYRLRPAVDIPITAIGT